jgi:hypothetical protein
VNWNGKKEEKIDREYCLVVYIVYRPTERTNKVLAHKYTGNKIFITNAAWDSPKNRLSALEEKCPIINIVKKIKPGTRMPQKRYI